MFLYTNIWHFALRDFSLNFVICGGGEGIYLFKKQFTLRDIFILKKLGTLRYVAVYIQPDTMRCILISKKLCTFLYVHKYIIYRVILLPKYKRTYNQSDQIEK